MNKALILDRDGVINEERNYVYKPEDVVFIDGIFELCRYFAERTYLIIVITNQSGIGRGMYSESDYIALERWMDGEFRKQGVSIARTYCCPFHPTDGIGDYKRDSFDRKPNPGMIQQAQKEFNLDLRRCILIGDKESDIEAGLRAGVGTTVLHLGPQSSQTTQANLVIARLLDAKKLA